MNSLVLNQFYFRLLVLPKLFLFWKQESNKSFFKYNSMVFSKCRGSHTLKLLYLEAIWESAQDEFNTL